MGAYSVGICGAHLPRVETRRGKHRDHSRRRGAQCDGGLSARVRAPPPRCEDARRGGHDYRAGRLHRRRYASTAARSRTTPLVYDFRLGRWRIHRPSRPFFLQRHRPALINADGTLEERERLNALAPPSSRGAAIGARAVRGSRALARASSRRTASTPSSRQPARRVGGVGGARGGRRGTQVRPGQAAPPTALRRATALVT